MSTLTICNLDESLERKLRMRAASRNRSMEEEARQILRAALLEPPVPARDLATRIRAHLVGLGDMELNVPQREPVREPPRVDEGAKAARAAPPKRQVRTQRRA